MPAKSRKTIAAHKTSIGKAHKKSVASSTTSSDGKRLKLRVKAQLAKRIRKIPSYWQADSHNGSSAELLDTEYGHSYAVTPFTLLGMTVMSVHRNENVALWNSFRAEVQRMKSLHAIDVSRLCIGSGFVGSNANSSGSGAAIREET